MFFYNAGKIFKASLTNPNRTTIIFPKPVAPPSNNAFLADEEKEDKNDDSLEKRKDSVSPNPIVVTPQYKVVFNFVAAATTLCFVVAVILALIPNPTELQKTLFTYCLEIFKLGFSASIGLLSGKSLS